MAKKKKKDTPPDDEILGPVGDEALGASEPDPDEVPDPEETAAAREEAKRVLDEAQAQLTEAQAHFKETDEAHTRALAAAEPELDPNRHLLISSGDSFSVVDTDDKSLKIDFRDRPRRITYNGQNFEHVSEDAHGIWQYRQMP